VIIIKISLSWLVNVTLVTIQKHYLMFQCLKADILKSVNIHRGSLAKLLKYLAELKRKPWIRYKRRKDIEIYKYTKYLRIRLE
jgi:hypothetical protein